MPDEQMPGRFERIRSLASAAVQRREVALLVLAAGLVLVLALCDLVDGASPRLAIWGAAALVVFIAGTLYVAQVLTVVISDEDVERALKEAKEAGQSPSRTDVASSLHEQNVNGIVRLAYVFTGVAAAITLVPFVLLPRMPAVEAILAQGAVGILRGCRAAGDHTPPELDCSKRGLQWLVNIGGVVTRRASDHPVVGVVETSKPAPAEVPASAAQPSEAVTKLRASLVEWNQRRGELVDEARRLVTARSQLLDAALASGASAKSDDERLEIVRLASAVTTQPLPTVSRAVERYEVQGGLVVPLYFEIVALMGAVVCMTRRVPEYQRRAGHEYEKAFTAANAEERKKYEPPLTSDEARDNLVFQIMQVLCAPLIACVAYSFVGPELPGSAVVLAFAAGFSSESILLRVRKMTNWLEGKGTEVMATAGAAKPAAGGGDGNPALVKPVEPSKAD